MFMDPVCKPKYPSYLLFVIEGNINDFNETTNYDLSWFIA